MTTIAQSQSITDSPLRIISTQAPERLERVESILQNQIMQLRLLTEELKKASEYTFSQEGKPVRLAIPSQHEVEFIKTDEIIHLEAQGNYTIIHLHDNSTRLYCQSLMHVAKRLSPTQFLRVHQSYLINRRFVKKYVKGNAGHLIMECGTMIPVSRSKKHVIKELF